MEFTFETEYNQKAIASMAEILRKTIRRKSNRRTHILGWIIVAVALLLTLPIGKEEFVIEFGTIITWIVVLIMVVTILFEDKINGYVAKKRMVAGMDKATSVFNDEKYVSFTTMGNTEWSYENIRFLAENKDYFAFVFDKSHAQIYDKNNLTGGTVDEFRKFIEEKTGKKFFNV